MTSRFNFENYLIDKGIDPAIAAQVTSGFQAALVIVAAEYYTIIDPIMTAILAMNEATATTTKQCAIDYADTHSEPVGDNSLIDCITV